MPKAIRATILGAGLALLAESTQAQEQPPRPVSELIAEFSVDPTNTSIFGMAVQGACFRAPGTWQLEYLSGVMALPPRPQLDQARVSYFSTLVELCNSELTSNWLRDFLKRSDDGYWVTIAASALGRSGSEANRVAALEALFDPRYDSMTRRVIAERWVAGQQSPSLGVVLLIAEAYETVAGVPSSEMHLAVSSLWNQETEAVRLRGVRRLLEVVLAEPERDAAVPIMASLFNLVPSMTLDYPWLIEFRAVVDQFASGERATSPELWALVMDRRRYFCGGATPAYRDGRCESL